MWKGSLVALVTPMESGSSLCPAIDWIALERLVHFHLQNGTDGLVVAGTTGEGATLSFEEQLELVQAVQTLVEGRLPVVAATGAQSTHETVRRTERMQAIGVDAVLVVTPFYNRPTQEGLYAHYRTLAESVDVPLILYNVPSRTGVDLQPETVLRLSRLRSVRGLKEASSELLSRMAYYAKHLGQSEFAVYAGNDAETYDALRLGAMGVISVVANAVPSEMHQLCLKGLDGSMDQALALHASLMPLFEACALEPNPIPIKWVLAEMDLIQPGIRLPLTPLRTVHHEAVRKVLRDLGLG